MKTPSYEPVQPSRMMPRFSFRWLFALTTVGAIVAAIAQIAGRGASGSSGSGSGGFGPGQEAANSGTAAALATGVLVTLGYLAALFAVFMLLFGIAWLVASLWYRPDDDLAQGSPFAADQLPPQILPPRESRQ